MADDATVRAIAEELAARYGGGEVLGLSGRSIIYQIASLLAGEMSRSDAATVAALKGLLPAAPLARSISGDQWDLDLLDERELGDLLALAVKARPDVPVMGEDGRLNLGARPRVSEQELLGALDEARSRAVRLEGELARHRAALQEVAEALAQAEAKAGASDSGSTPAGSKSGPASNVIAMPRRLSP
jgi:hypothetical protein